MDNFLQIDWNPPLDDIIDTTFVDTERLERESTLYRMLKGKFVDPFGDIHEEQDHLVTSEIMAQISLENNEQQQEKPNNAANTVDKIDLTGSQPNEHFEYCPGMGKKRVWQPRSSSLDNNQHALCLRVLLKFYGSERPAMTATDKEELQTYMSLLPTITKEQQEYLEFAKTSWDSSNLSIHEENFINDQWKKKLKRIHSLPRYYTESGSIPFVSEKEIGLNFHSLCLEMGILPSVILPPTNRRFILKSSTTKINQRYFSAETNVGLRKNVIFKKSVSDDPNCDKFAKDNDIDLVISSGGLNCLAINIDPQTTISWILPVVVKRINDKNVVYIDKPLPPTGLTIIQKNTWIYKYELKSFVNQPYHKNAISLDEEADKEIVNYRKSRNLQISDAPKSEEGSDKIVDTKNNENIKGFDENNSFLRPPIGHNLSYKIFSIGSNGEHQSELLKNRVEKSYKLLVRTKADGASRQSDGASKLMLIAPKLEHQLNLGAEAVTSEEAAKQWISLAFRPDTTLARVRIDAETSEVIQIENRTVTSVNNEIKRLYKLKTESAITLLYNVAETMTNMMPGRYLLRHSVRSGAFANIYKEVDGPGKNALDLQTVFCEEEFRTIPNSSWPLIDQGVVTPVMKLYKRMPAMFRSGRIIHSVNKKNKGKKKQKKNSKANAVRQSLRKKGHEDSV